MAYNFNTSPYYDDFSSSKNFHRILFQPGYAVQARELTQAQSILQNQITNFADNIFKQNTPISGGQVTTNLNCDYIRLQQSSNNIITSAGQFLNQNITDATGTIVAKVIQVAETIGNDPPTLIVSYQSGSKFTDNSTLYVVSNPNISTNVSISSNTITSTGLSSVASIASGVFYVLGNFVQVNPSTIILDKYDNIPNLRLGLTISENIINSSSDSSLLDPAVGASNYQAPGADRYQINLTLSTRPLTLGDDSDFIELVRYENGVANKLVDTTVYNVIDDYFAMRDYETNGDYIVNNFKLTPKTTQNDPLANTYTLSVSKGLAYVHGYRLENLSPVDLISPRARTTSSQNNNPIYMNYGSYFYVDTLRGANGSFFDVTTDASIDLHCVSLANVSLSSAATYNSTLVATGYIRNLAYDHFTNESNTATYVYKAYVNDLQNQVVTANVVSASVNTITLPSTYSAVNGAYVGINISITTGTDAGDFRTITAYNGSTKVATVNQNWTTTPDTTSVFALNFDTKDIETILSVNKSGSYTIQSSANINAEGKTNGVITGNTILENPNTPELIFPIGNPYVASLSGTSYQTQQLWRNIQFNQSANNSISATLSYNTTTIRHIGQVNSTLSLDTVKQNFIIVVTNKGTNSTINVGDIIPWGTASNPLRTITLNPNGTSVQLTATDGALSNFTASIFERVDVTDADNTSLVLKSKNLIQANTTTICPFNLVATTVATYTQVDNSVGTSTGQIYIRNAGIVTPGTKQSLYLSDVKGIVKIVDTGSPSVDPTSNNISSLTDVTSNFTFDNGQRDSFYDHASVTLKPGAPAVQGNLLIYLNYYQHVGGDGYFTLASYINSNKPDDYRYINAYTSKHGVSYQLRDCVDFRPARLNAQTSFAFRYSNNSNTNYGALIPSDLSLFTGNYSYYIGRIDKLIYSKDSNLAIIQGSPSLYPIAPSEPDGSLVIATLTHDPYTSFLPAETPAGTLSSLSVVATKHKRYTMQDIASLDNRITNVEYYTALNQLEQSASSLQISDAYGLNRFKNGIMTDNFSDYSTADTYNSDYSACIDTLRHQMTAPQHVQNFPLNALALAYNMGLLSNTARSSLGYGINSDGLVNYFSLPYTTANVIVQQYASRDVNVNPFSVSLTQGTVSLTPNVDNWVDTKTAPALLITDPNLQVFQSTPGALNVLQVGNWQAVSGTSSSTSQSFINHGTLPAGQSPFGSVVGYTASTTATTTNLQQNNVVGAYTNIGNTYSINNGYVTNVSILPYIQSQRVVISVSGMLSNTKYVKCLFDGINVSNYVRRLNTIEVSNVSGTFKVNDTIGYIQGGSFILKGWIVGIYHYPNSTNVRLYLGGDGGTDNYTASGITGSIQTGTFDQYGNYSSSTASGTITSNNYFSGRVKSVDKVNNTVTMYAPAPNVDNYYSNMVNGTSNTMYIVQSSSTSDNGFTAGSIINYVGATRTATVTSTTGISAGDLFSIGPGQGPFTTNEDGSFYALFWMPGGTFHTGQRTFRVDNSINVNANSATTFAEGTFYAEGLQTTSQGIDFSASPAGAKNTFIQTTNQVVNNTITNYTPYDPVAQSFIVFKDAYPNGLFLKSIKLFFVSKPTHNSTPVKLSIVNTINGYPSGDTLNYSIVTLKPSQVNTSIAPQYLDSNAYTEFVFSAPVYIQPDVLYAFIVHSPSNEYVLWSASGGDVAKPSSARNLPTDPSPTVISKINGAPYVGGLFLSQNSQTWTADQNQSLMFVADRFKFDTTATPTIPFVVPTKLPQRAIVDERIDYFLNANNVSNTVSYVTNSDVLVDAFNVTTTDFTPSTTSINYSYNATLSSGGAAGTTNIIPGKFGTATNDDIYLTDGSGERILVANSNASFTLYATLSSQDDAVSPIISDSGLSTYVIQWGINNCELSSNTIVISSGGTGYNANTTTVTISPPTSPNGGTTAQATANIANGVIQSINFTNYGSGYITTPTITISDPATRSGNANVTFTVTGETSSHGGNASTKYLSKKVVLAAGNDSGDLNVYVTGYRPVNTDIVVYYKILNRSDTQKFDDGSWQVMTMINNSQTLYSTGRTDLHEFVFAPGTGNIDQGYVTYTSTSGQTYTSFSQFAIKIILTSSDHTFTPFLNDLRVIALPSNTNTSV
jgi:hypothetical protein